MASFSSQILANTNPQALAQHTSFTTQNTKAAPKPPAPKAPPAKPSLLHSLIQTALHNKVDHMVGKTAKDTLTSSVNAAKTVGRAGIVNPVRLGAAELTHNTTALNNVGKSIIQNSPSKVIGAGLQTASLALPGSGRVGEAIGAKGVGVLSKALVGATKAVPAGATFGAGQAISEGKKPLEIAKGAGTGAVAAGVLGAGGSILRSTVPGVQKVVTAFKGKDTKFTNHVYTSLSKHLDNLTQNEKTSNTITESGMSRLSSAEQKAKSELAYAKSQAQTTSQKLLEAPKLTQKLLDAPKQNFIIPRIENARIMDGTAKLAKEYDKDYRQTLKSFGNSSPKRLADEVDRLDNKYIERHTHLLNATGEFAAQRNRLATSVSKAKTSRPTAIFKDAPKPAKIVKASSETSPTATKTVSTPRVESKTLSPTNGTATSGVAKSIEARAIEKKLAPTTGFDELSGFNKTTHANENAKVADLITSNPDKAISIAKGHEPLPSNISSSKLLIGLEEHAHSIKDPEASTSLLRDLAKSPLATEASLHGQELGLMAKRNPSSIVANIQSVLKSRTQAVEGKLKQTLPKVVSQTTKEIKASVPKVTKETWHSFAESLRC